MGQSRTPKDKDNKVRPAGGALDWSDEELDALAEITDADIADARENAAQYPTLDALLNAREDDEA
jgi:hypothetical protein